MIFLHPTIVPKRLTTFLLQQLNIKKHLSSHLFGCIDASHPIDKILVNFTMPLKVIPKDQN